LLRIVDTAGLRSASGEVETQGIERSLRQIERADIVLLVLDSTQPAPPLPRQVADSAALGKLVVIANKCDLPGSCAGGTLFEGIRTLRLSALTGEGLDELRRRIVELIETRIVPEADGAVLVGARHAEALRAMLEALRNALEKLSNGGPAELVASDLNSAAAALEQILGRIDNEKMLDQLFANFCIGK
jgi:tRNA modification GTPase